MDASDVRQLVEDHLQAVGDVDIDRLCGLYAPDARLYDPAGASPVVGREAIRGHFSHWLTAVRRITSTRIVITGRDNSLVAVSFSATAEGGDGADVLDVMRVGSDLLIAEMHAFAVSHRTARDDPA